MSLPLTPSPGLRKTYSSRHLELQLMQKSYSRRRMDCLNNCCSHCSQVSSSGVSNPNIFLMNILLQYRSSATGDHRGIEVSLSRHHHVPLLHKINEYDCMIHQHSTYRNCSGHLSLMNEMLMQKTKPKRIDNTVNCRVVTLE